MLSKAIAALPLEKSAPRVVPLVVPLARPTLRPAPVSWSFFRKFIQF